MSMSQQEQAKGFSALHQPGEPLLLYNIWDAGSARIVEEAGALAIATGSWSVAAALGYEDGEQVPLETVLRNARRIAKSVSVPVTIDFEGAYSLQPKDVAKNVSRLIETGVVGMNFEDQNVAAGGQHSIEFQAERIAAARKAAQASGVNFFINARTDTFLQTDAGEHDCVVRQAIERGLAYQAAGASGFFVPGLSELALISQICNAVGLPVNAMATDSSTTYEALADAGVARISHGPAPYRHMAATLMENVQSALGSRA